MCLVFCLPFESCTHAVPALFKNVDVLPSVPSLGRTVLKARTGLCSKLLYVLVCVQSLYALSVFETRTYCLCSKLEPTVCLRNPNLLSCIQNQNVLYVIETRRYCLQNSHVLIYKLALSEFETGSVCIVFIGKHISGPPGPTKISSASPRPSKRKRAVESTQTRATGVLQAHRSPRSPPATATPQNTHQ